MVTNGASGLGIDFGTSTTVAMLAGADGVARPLLFDASPLLPSAVFAAPGGDLLTGADAERAAVAYPAAYEPNPKRRVDERTVLLGEREITVVDLVAAVLRRVAAEAERATGAPPPTVVLTHPATWGPTRLAVLAGGAERAGLGAARFVPEPVAAAAYLAGALGDELPPGRCLVVYDLGAGTFDVSAVRSAGATFEVVASAGLGDVGGLDLDAAVVGLARDTLTAGPAVWQRLDRPRTQPDQEARHQLWHGARAVKEQLSRHATGDLRIPVAAATLHVTREQFEALALPYLRRTVEVTLRTLRAARITHDQVAGIFLVGGGSRVPLAATLLHRATGIAPSVLDHPELAVAAGSLHVPPAAPIPGQRPPEPLPSALPDPPTMPAVPEPRSPTEELVLGPPPFAPGSVWDDEPVLDPLVASPAPRVAPAAERVRRLGVWTVLAALVAGVAAVAVWWPHHPRQAGPSRQADRLPALAPARGLGAATELPGHGGAVLALAFAPDSATLLSGGGDTTVRLWDVAAHAARGQPLTGHANPVRAVRFSPDGAAFATGGYECGRLWRTDTAAGTGAPTAVPATTGAARATAGIVDIAYHDGTPVAVGFAAGEFRLWDLAAAGELGTLTPDGKASAPAAPAGPASPAAAPQATSADAVLDAGGRWAAYGHDRTVEVHAVAGRTPVAALATSPATRLAFSPDGRTLAVAATAGGAAFVEFWDPAGAALSGTARDLGHPVRITAMVYDHGGALLATGDAGGRVVLLDAAGRRPVATTGPTGAPIQSLAFSPDGAWLATGDSRGMIRLHPIRR
ncbi:Hsp70 family protein [Dactylosporangium aurantiacum]|uniref:Hsp70 family protein n=1 Tax=Dactylosporangium aurantiacum TaxID=35754 RepID=A0A9Q9MA55_9ACTN|nr:Hsp70 family protein [Dactylosporangium aurantiacum]MDG6107179.1 Hsp70 family protein [Dactylosporangium aurantiacum]UWZ51473.1 Hsp70 family protein [Dactylosporangium aurantiacum]